MKIVLDTNVFVSGIFWSGPPSNVLSLWQQGNIILCITPNILEEYTRVGRILMKKYANINLEPFLELVTLYGEIFPDFELPEPASRDPDDDKFIACAVSAKANLVVSGDKDLLDLRHYNGIKIISPKQFLSQMVAH